MAVHSVVESMREHYPSLNKGLTSFEKVLNVAGYVPVVSNFSGALRIGYGKVEVVAAVAAGAFLMLKGLFNSDAQMRSREVRHGFDVMAYYALHGLANICRGFVESIFLIGNATCLIYDFAFDKRFAYPCRQSQ